MKTFAISGSFGNVRASSSRILSARSGRPARARAWPSLRAISRSGELLKAISSDNAAVRGKSAARAASASILCADVLFGSFLRICSAMLIASMGLERKAIWPLASSGDLLALPNIFFRKPPLLPARLSWVARNASRQV